MADSALPLQQKPGGGIGTQDVEYLGAPPPPLGPVIRVVPGGPFNLCVDSTVCRPGLDFAH